ncbi:flagellar basal body P-ring formation chaperone FlgA [Chitinilyticum piscinae]|uniref:Flagella basal body P-ring formation protein FlgA n=1 Tax=Chitinilyticum piscinae TaxID=2866724 RepID=A0A8J7FHP5_9NEIS|nr:flagellar basal body P-ring formation chaperone FlgA [Chitinilyticum piscinae]MBE9609445.1 flagellar basal body P-ring formation protein FlgA [Chitinilyticum piscinae]
MKRLLIILLLAMIALYASAAPAGQDMSLVLREVSQWLDAALARAPGQSSYSVGKLDSRLRLEACQQMEVSVPSGQRLIGNVLLRVRCTSGAAWSLNVPVQVSLSATYYVATRPLAANQTISDHDLMPQQGDLANLPGSVILDPAIAIGRTLNSAVPAGQPLRREMLRAAMVIQQNQKVRIIYRLDDIEVVNDGIALAAASEGSPVRVRVSGGNVISGIARANGDVEVGH